MNLFLEFINKIRVIMRKRGDSYKLEDMVEYDEAFVGRQ